MRTRQNGFLGVSKAAALGWAEALASAENAGPATKAICPKEDALLLEGRRVPSDGQYLDTIRQTRLALLPE